MDWELDMNRIAKGEFTVKMQPILTEVPARDSRIGRMTIEKALSGDLMGTGSGEMLSAMTDTQGSAAYVAIDVIEGTLHGMQGSFVLQHTGSMNRGAPSLAITVVPDSGTGALVGISGRFEIIRADGKHSYVFTYMLP